MLSTNHQAAAKQDAHKKLFHFFVMTTLHAVAGRPTTACFTGFAGKEKLRRDPKFDYRLPNVQPDAEPCMITTAGFEREWTLEEAAAAFLQADASTNPAFLGRMLSTRGHTMTLPQAEEMLMLAGREWTGIHARSPSETVFFTEARKPKGSILVGAAHRHSRGWDVHFREFGDFHNRLSGDRLLLRNAGEPKHGS